MFVTIQASLLVKKANEILSTLDSECRRPFSEAPSFFPYTPASCAFKRFTYCVYAVVSAKGLHFFALKNPSFLTEYSNLINDTFAVMISAVFPCLLVIHATLYYSLMDLCKCMFVVGTFISQCCVPINFSLTIIILSISLRPQRDKLHYNHSNV